MIRRLFVITITLVCSGLLLWGATSPLIAQEPTKPISQLFKPTQLTTLSHAELVADINQTFSPTPNNFQNGVSYNGHIYFQGQGDGVGDELWAYNLATKQVTLTADFIPGNNTAPVYNLTLFSDTIYIVLGNNNGTFHTYDPALNSFAYFSETVGVTVYDPYQLTSWQGSLYFVARNQTGYYGLWQYNPTVPTATEIITSSYTSRPFDQLTPLDGKLYLNATSPQMGAELWVYDSNMGALSLAADIYSGTVGSYPYDIEVLNGRLYFSAWDNINGSELWEYDPNTSLATRLSDIYSGTNSSFPSLMTALDNQLYFRAKHPTTGNELWRYNPTTSVLTQVVDLSTWSNGSFPEQLTVLDNKLYFRANSPEGGSRLWVYDPAISTTRQITAGVGYDLYVANNFLPVGDQLYFSALDNLSAHTFWGYTPNTETVFPALQETGTAGSNPTNLASINGVLYFSADDGVTGRELWSYDPILNTATQVADIITGATSSSPLYLHTWNGKLYFVADHESGNDYFWVYDPVTAILTPTSPAPTTKGIYSVDQVGNMFYLGGLDTSNNSAMWVYDADLSTINLVASESSWGSFGIRELETLGDKVYFQAWSLTTGFELWAYDLISATTSLVYNIAPGNNHGSPNRLMAFNDQLFFSANNGIFGYELWRHDPNTNQTTLIGHIAGGTQSSYPDQFTIWNGKLYFNANDQIHGTELWVYDPVSETVELVYDVWLGVSGSRPTDMVVYGNLLYFAAERGDTGREIWSYNATTNELKLVADIYTGSGSSKASGLHLVNGEFYLSTNGSNTGLELWRVTPPIVARDDLFVTSQNISVTGNILSNDSLLSGIHALDISLLSMPSLGGATVGADGTFTYTPNLDVTGTDSFQYLLTHGRVTDTGWITVTINEINQAPIANSDSYTTNENITLIVSGSLNSLLANDNDPNNDNLVASLLTPPTHGLIDMNASGEFVYTPTLGCWGADTFDYAISDGLLTSTAQVSITIVPVAEAPLLAITSSGASKTLNWSVDDSNCQYDVHQSNADPYFIPSESTLQTSLPSGSDTFTPTVTTAYFVVQAVGCANDMADSNRVGVFTFALVPGN